MCRSQVLLSPFGRLEGQKNEPECTVQWNFADEWFDNPWITRPVTPVDDHGFVALQNGQARILSGELAKALYNRMGHLQTTSKGIQGRSQWQQPNSELISPALDALHNSIVHEGIDDPRNSWQRQCDLRADARQRNRTALRHSANNTNGSIDYLNGHRADTSASPCAEYSQLSHISSKEPQ
jgi:hypothetical protein